VRPGGWVAAIEPDFTTVSLSPTNLVWERTWSLFCDAIVAGGWDPHYGARLGRDLRAAGLSDIHTDCITRCHPGGSLSCRLLPPTLERLRERMVLLGADEDEIDKARRQLADPASTLKSATSCVARGRRPVLA
jgi:hypothetical protein